MTAGAVPRERSALRRLAAGLGSPAAARLACWYLGLLVPTLAFKSHFLDVSYVGGIAAVTRPLAASAGTIPEWLYRALVFTGDLIEVLALQAAVLVLGGVLLRLRLEVLTFASVLACLTLGALNYVCSRQIGQFLSLDVARDVTMWLRTNPEGLTGFATPRRLAAVPAGLALAYVPVVAARRLAAGGGAGRLVSLATAAVLVAAVVLHGGLLRTAFAAEPAFRGYWSQAVVSFLGGDEPDPRRAPAPAVAALREAYRRIAFPAGTAASPAHLVEIAPSARRPRHIVIVSLETAAAKYYRLGAEDSWPVLMHMAEQAVVSDLHYTTAPYTTSALFSVLSGAYPHAGALLSRYGEIGADGLPSVLKQRGYEATYIESSVVGFWKDYLALLRGLGFDVVREGPEPSVPSRLEQAIRNEELAFGRALEAVVGAAARGRKAVVCLSSSFGHFPWKVRPEESALPGPEKLIRIGRVFDRLLGELLAGLEARGLRDDVVVVVTGDHGPRYLDELASLGEELGHGDATFNVPLLVHAPGLLPSRVRLPYVTSHIDITPTLLHLVGLEPEALLLHGGSLLDGRLRDRVTYLMGAGLYPVDGFHWRGHFYTENRVTGEVAARTREGGAAGPGPRPLSDADARRLLRSARQVFESTAAVFLERGSREPAR